MKVLSLLQQEKRHVIALILAWGLFSILLGLLTTLDFLESSTDIQVLHGILNGLTVVISAMTIGLVLIIIPILLLNKKYQAQ